MAKLQPLRHCEIVQDVDKIKVDIQATCMKYRTIKQWAYIIHDKDDTRPHFHIYLNFGNLRQSFGHWEMDCLCGPTKEVWLMLTERLTRYEIIFQMRNQKAESVVHCLNRLEYKYGKLFRKVFKTITVDNGSEFSDFDGIQRSIYKGKRTTVYYCHPYSSYERGTNERINREVRRLVPKGTDLSKYCENDVSAVQKWVNNYPRQVLDFATSRELFSEQLKQLA